MRQQAVVPGDQPGSQTDIHTEPDTLLSRFDDAARHDPSAVAVRSGTSAMTYGTLADASRALARRLEPLVADRPGPVAVLLEPGPGQVCAALAAMRCGKPYLPVDLSYPRQRIDSILADAAPAAVIGHEVADPGGSGAVDVGSEPGHDSRITAGQWGDSARVTADDAYVIYTSGSTGSPKGIVVQHRGILNLLDECVARRELAPGSRYSTCASPGFDAAVLEAWTSLTTGGELVVTPDSRRWHPAEFARWLADERIAHSYVPAAFLPAVAQGLRDGLDLRSLRRIIVAVEPIPRGLLGEIKRALPDLTLINGYGPTEASVCVSMYEVTEDDEGPERTPIGTAIRGTELVVEPLEGNAQAESGSSEVVEPGTDEPGTDEPRTDGSGADGSRTDESRTDGSGADGSRADGSVRGELHIGGVGVGRYIHPETTQRPAFYTRTTPDGGSTPFYRTGDVVRMDSDGMLTFLGRVDHMIKIRGHRVEPGDVEHALLDEPALAQAVVLKRPAEGPGGGDAPGAGTGPASGAGLASGTGTGAGTGSGIPEQLVAYVVPEADASPDLARIRRRLRERLPWYAVPHQIVVRDALPLTTHGKIDRTALAADTHVPALAATPSEHPQRDDVEPELLSLWNEVLGEAYGRPDPRLSFLANGGDSLAAGRMAAALTERLGRPVPVLDILLADDLADLQEVVSRTLAETSPPGVPTGAPTAYGTAAPRLRAPGPGEPVPATYGQRGLWFHDSLHPGSTVYNEPLVLRLRGPLDRDALASAISAVVERHEALRTSLEMHDGELRQVVRPPEPVELAVEDLRTAERDRAGAVRRSVRDAVHTPFDLSRGPHLRARLLHCGDDEHVLVLTLHHSAFDGASADVLFGELSALYTEFTTGEPSGLGPPEGQYAEFALWQHEMAAGGHFDEDVEYWRRQLEGLPEAMDLPTDFPRPETPSGDGALARARLSPELVGRIDELAHTTGATRYTALLAALHILLSRYCGTEDVAVGAPFSGRDLPRTARSVGYYLNMLPLRAGLSGGTDSPDAAAEGEGPDFRQLLARTRQTVTGAYAHQQAPYGLLLEKLPGKSSAENPYLQVCLVPEDVYRHEMTFAGVESEFEYHDTGIAKFDLTVNVIPDPGGGLRLTAEYSTDLFRAATVERLLGHFRTLLESATADPGLPVRRLPMLSAAERAQILGTFAGGPPSASPHGTAGAGTAVHELVGHWAESTPEAVALVSGDEEPERLTYRELVGRADQLAHYLAERGAEPGTRVGVRLPHGVDAVVAFLAVLKTGAAYVPLDPSYPAQRLAYMAEDADLVAELTAELLEEDRAAIEGGPRRAPMVAVRGDDIAYVVYTSGSTGRPKGVQVPHSAVVDLALGAPRWAGLDSGTRLLLVASLSFDLVTFDMWGTLGNGGRLVLPPTGPSTPDALAAHMARHAVTHADMPTALFHRQAEAAPSSLAGIGTVVVGGEVLNPALAAAALEAAPGMRLINAYGPTEATTYATYHVMNGPGDVSEPVPIGRPTPNTRVRILDEQGQLVPVGLVGELHLGGPGLAVGYLGNPGATAERFVEDPYGPPGERLYATGDLVRWQPDGTVDYVGRGDEQIKLYGFRVEPGEIEAALRTHPDVTHAVVTRREDRPGSPYLAAYFTTAQGREVSSRELTELAAGRLPSYMVPRVLTAMERFPVTAGGKIDRAALPVPSAAGGAPGRAQDGGASDGGERQGELWDEQRGERSRGPHSGNGAPAAPGTAAPGATPGATASGAATSGATTPATAPEAPVPEGSLPEDSVPGLAYVQEEIARIWRDVVTVDELGPDDRLFDIGGASLHVTLIHQRVAERFGLSRLRMIDLFGHPTVREYAAHVHRLCTQEAAPRTEAKAGGPK
ncbi:non-ribosomal peptide synthetase [Streptomyces marispadix]|uniref:Amino acid adenylation domain-containing protein n=1 Tax=Streptomyces marispadix TaxID=2922868 RepID=A0ABS9SYB2_9ACTN|nr:non-ribosomal peptide synthetase [Streptomyces marispadix]MCH6161257.1 amino acid adenylation domain-containing protein [Streptomyces marispadix]